jgi:recombination protein RecT
MTNEMTRYPTCPEIAAFLRSKEQEISRACAAQLSASQVIQLAVLCCYHTPKLLQCNLGSLLDSVIKAAKLGLDLDPAMGECYLIPRRNQKLGKLLAKCEVGYKGWIRLALESGRVRYVHARTVHEHDDFEWLWNPELTLYHRLARDGRQGATTHAYAVAKLDTGEVIGECLTVEEIGRYRARSERPNDGPWKTDPEPMGEKTAVLRLADWLPKTAKISLALAIEKEDGGEVDVQLVEPPAGELPDGEVPSIEASASPALEPPMVAKPTKAQSITAQIAARAAGLNGNAKGLSVSVPIVPGTNGVHKPADPPPAAPPAKETAARMNVLNVNLPKPVVRKDKPEKPARPTTGPDLERFAADHLLLDWFTGFGKSRGFGRPPRAWSHEQVKRAMDHYDYEVEVGTLTMSNGNG